MTGFGVFVCLLTLSYVLTERKLPSYIKPCKRFDPNISNCWENTLLQLKPYLAKGIPEFDVPPTTEFRIDHIHLDQGNTQNVNFIADLDNITFHGGENFDVSYTNADFQKLVLEEGLTFPKLTMNAPYKAKGRVLIFEFEGQGFAKGEFEDVKINGTWYFKIINKKGKQHIQVDKSELQVYPGKMWVYFDNLFSGNPEITKNVNNAINENTDVLLNDFQPLLQKTLSSVLNQYLNRVYSLYPLDVLLPLK